MYLSALYPEGPLYHKGILYYVDYLKNELYHVTPDYVSSTKLPYKGPCGLAYCPSVDDIIIAFYDSHKIFLLTSFKELDIPFPNDMCTDDFGGIFVTSSADYGDDDRDPFTAHSPASGSVYYLTPSLNLFKMPIQYPIHYANGIVLDKRKPKLYVSEHLKNRILSFDIMYTFPGNVADVVPVLNNQEVYLNLPSTISSTPLLGPDGLCTDKENNLYVAHYGGGCVLKYDQCKTLKKVYHFTHSNVTNVTCDIVAQNIFVTVAGQNHNYQGYVTTLQ